MSARFYQLEAYYAFDAGEGRARRELAGYEVAFEYLYSAGVARCDENKAAVGGDHEITGMCIGRRKVDLNSATL